MSSIGWIANLAKGSVPDHGNDVVSDGHREYDYLDWIARLTSHIPEKGAQLVHYCGAYSNAHRGIARRREVFVGVPPEDEPPDPPRPDSVWHATRRKSWARLIRRVYEIDSLLCRCGERMRVVGFITQAPVIRNILGHIGRRFDPLVLPGREMRKKKIPISQCNHSRMELHPKSIGSGWHRTGIPDKRGGTAK